MTAISVLLERPQDRVGCSSDHFAKRDGNVTHGRSQRYRELVDVDSGELERVAEGSWRVPAEVKLAGERLYWKGPFARSVQPGPRLLEDFLQLADAPAEKIEAYARRWGLIGVCSDRMPFSWRRRFDACEPLGLSRKWFQTGRSKPPWEPIGVWRFISRQLRGFLNVVAVVREEELAAERDLQDMRGQGPLAFAWEADPHHFRSPSIPSLRGQAEAANKFMHQARSMTEIVPVFFWGDQVILIHGTTCRPGDTVSGLYHTLVMQACMAATQSQGWALCSVGNHPYARGSRSRSGQRNYCPEHRKTAAAATRAVEYRKRVRVARRLSKEGMSLKKIAAKLGRPPRQVKMWIG